jgi:hypothetical protein
LLDVRHLKETPAQAGRDDGTRALTAHFRHEVDTHAYGFPR